LNECFEFGDSFVFLLHFLEKALQGT